MASTVKTASVPKPNSLGSIPSLPPEFYLYLLCCSYLVTKQELTFIRCITAVVKDTVSVCLYHISLASNVVIPMITHRGRLNDVMHLRFLE